MQDKTNENLRNFSEAAKGIVQIINERSPKSDEEWEEEKQRMDELRERQRRGY